MLLFREAVGVGAIGGINRLIEQVRREIVLKPCFMRPRLLLDVGRDIPGLFV